MEQSMRSSPDGPLPLARHGVYGLIEALVTSVEFPAGSGMANAALVIPHDRTQFVCVVEFPAFLCVEFGLMAVGCGRCPT